nr:MAG TPA: hypothetical protein [Caudoviricetes sp.]
MNSSIGLFPFYSFIPISIHDYNIYLIYVKIRIYLATSISVY